MKKRNFDFHKFATISMIVVGVGFFLFSLIFSRNFWKVEGLDRENQKTTQLSTSRPVNGGSRAWTNEYSEPLDESDHTQHVNEAIAAFDQRADALRELAEAIAAEAWEQIPILVEEWKSVMAQRAAHNRVQPHDEEWGEVMSGFTDERQSIEHKIIEYAMKYHGVYPEDGAIYLPDGKIAQLTEQVGLVFTDGSN